MAHQHCPTVFIRTEMRCEGEGVLWWAVLWASSHCLYEMKNNQEDLNFHAVIVQEKKDISKFISNRRLEVEENREKRRKKELFSFPALCCKVDRPNALEMLIFFSFHFYVMLIN